MQTERVIDSFSDPLFLRHLNSEEDKVRNSIKKLQEQLDGISKQKAAAGSSINAFMAVHKLKNSLPDSIIQSFKVMLNGMGCTQIWFNDYKIKAYTPKDRHYDCFDMGYFQGNREPLIELSTWIQGKDFKTVIDSLCSILKGSYVNFAMTTGWSGAITMYHIRVYDDTILFNPEAFHIKSIYEKILPGHPRYHTCPVSIARDINTKGIAGSYSWKTDGSFLFEGATKGGAKKLLPHAQAKWPDGVFAVEGNTLVGRFQNID